MLLHDVLAFAARRSPDAPALIADGVTRTFAELDDRVGRLAGALAANGERGDRVAVVADNCGPWIECYYGVPRAGMVLAPLNQRLTPAEQADILATSAPTMLIGERSRPTCALPLADRFPSVRTVAALDEPGWDGMLAAHTPLEPILDQRPDETAWLLFTSGTTGRPKGALLTHTSLFAAIVSVSFGRPIADDEVLLTAFPLCHVAGFNVVAFHLHGRPAVVQPRFHADEFAAAIVEHRVTTASMAPTMLSSLLAHLDATGTVIPTLRTVGHGGGAMPAELLRRARERLDITFNDGYGMTELSGSAIFNGVPTPLVSVRIVDASMNDVAMNDAHAGELVLRGDQVSPGYWNDPVATAEAWAGGWFHTGDLARWVDGRIRIVDRLKDLIITGGENVTSREVEDVLHGHPAVAEVAVVGIPDEHWGEAICAVVVASDEVTGDELIAHARERLAGFKQPRHVVFVEALPTNSAGKILKAELRRLAAEHLT